MSNSCPTFLYESSQNQSLLRVYRIGQTKKCFIYRFVALGTIEEKIFNSEDDLQQLYSVDNLDPPTRSDSYTPTGEDDLLHSIFQKHGDIVHKHRNHDSLIEKGPEETDTEEDVGEYSEISD